LDRHWLPPAWRRLARKNRRYEKEREANHRLAPTGASRSGSDGGGVGGNGRRCHVLLSRQRPSDDSEKDEADGREDCAHEKHEGKIAALYGNNPDPQEAKGK